MESGQATLDFRTDDLAPVYLFLWVNGVGYHRSEQHPGKQHPQDGPCLSGGVIRASGHITDLADYGCYRRQTASRDVAYRPKGAEEDILQWELPQFSSFGSPNVWTSSVARRGAMAMVRRVSRGRRLRRGWVGGEL